MVVLAPVTLPQGMAQDVEAEKAYLAVETLVGLRLGLGQADDAVKCVKAGTKQLVGMLLAGTMDG